MSEAQTIAEWRRAEGCLQVAQICLQHGFYADAISRAYYAVFHAAKASLELYEVSTRNHRGVNILFSRHIVQPGLVESGWSSVIGRLAPMRISADYVVATVFSEADADYACQQAGAFADRIHALLTGIINPERLRPFTN